MGVRRERVVLELEDDFTAKLARAAAAAQVFQKSLGKTRGESDRTSQSLSKADRDTQKFSATVTRSTRELDSYSGRLGLVASAIGTIGPALIPITAVAIPAVTGLAQSFGLAAVAGGTAILAFQGVGDALEAMNKAHLKPTTANIEKAREAMEQLSPAARGLVQQLASMRDEFKGLKDAAGSGILPGATAALADLETRLPIVEKILHQVSVAVGSALQQGAESLAGPSWDRFFRFIANEARPELAKLAGTVGNLAHAFADLWVAFGPLNNSFSSFLLKSARDFNSWATGLSQTQGFQDFIAYIRENGPKVGDALAAIGNALVQIVQAAAPIGGPLLESLTAMANVIATIADSPLGTPIFGAIAALSAFSLATKAWGGVAGSAVGKFIAGQREAGVAIATNAAKMRTFGLVTQEQAAATAKGWRTVGKGALVLGGITAASSGLTDKLHLTNAALFASAGLIAGGWGAAIGAGIGLVADFASAHHKTSISVDEVTQTLNQQTGAITANTRVWAAKNLQDSGAADAAQSLGLNLATVTAAALGNATAIAQVNDQLDRLKPQGGLTGGGQQWVDADKTANAIEDVRDAVSGSSSAVQQAVGKQRQFASLMGTVAVMSGSASRAVDRLAHAITDLDDLLDKRGARNAFKQSVLDLRAAIKNEGADFRASTLNGLRHRDMLDQVAKNAETLSQKVGPLERKRILREAIGDLHDFAGKSASAKAYAQPLIDKLRELEKLDPKIRIAVEAQQALAEIARVRAYLDSLHNKDVSVAVTRRVVEQTGLPKADGGFISGPGGPRDDQIPAWLSNGEFVVNAAATARHRGELERINAQKFADGGYAGGNLSTYRQVGGGGADIASVIARSRKAFEDHTKATIKSTQAIQSEEKQRLDSLMSQRDSLRSTVTGAFRSDLFGAPSNVWASGSGNFNQILRGDIANAQQFTKAIRAARTKGLNGQALAAVEASGDPLVAEQFAHMTRQQIARYERLFNVRERVSGAAGRYAGNAVYGSQIEAVRDELRGTNQRLDKLRRELHDHPKKTGEAVAHGVNHATTKGARNHRRAP
jgi:hypothetical protein